MGDDEKLTIANAEKRVIFCERWTRVVGYYRPVDAFNPGKQQEYHDRVAFKLPTEGGRDEA
jgi:ribonucleoside-triphosphate reductase (formate)